MALAIDRSLNLVVRLDRDDGTRLHVHSMPIGYDVYRTYSVILARVFSAIGSIGINAGPRVAYQVLEETARSVARITPDGVGTWWEGETGVERGLVGEMVRLSNVLVPAEGGGWQQMQLADALRPRPPLGPFLSREEGDDVLSQLTFFTVGWWAAPRTERRVMTQMGARLYDSQTTSSGLMEFMSSLTMSTADGSTHESA